MSRLLSVIMAVVGMVAMIAKHGMDGALGYLLFLLVALVLIWFPSVINGYAMGTMMDGSTVDTPTPPLLIAAFGWIALLVVNGFVLGWW